jgi:hypothetical protein
MQHHSWARLTTLMVVLSVPGIDVNAKDKRSNPTLDVFAQ